MQWMTFAGFRTRQFTCVVYGGWEGSSIADFHSRQFPTSILTSIPFLLGKKALNNIWVPCNAGKGLNRLYNFLYLVKKGSTLSIYVGCIVHVHVWRGVELAVTCLVMCAHVHTSERVYVWCTGYGCGAEYLCVYSLIMAAVVTVAM